MRRPSRPLAMKPRRSGDGSGACWKDTWKAARDRALLLSAPSPICPAITHAGVRRRAGKSPARFRSGPSQEGFACGGAPEEGTFGMALPEFSMRQLLEAGAHFGHQTHRWNPKMERYIFGSRSNIHIIDLSQTMPLLHQALVKVREVAASGGRVLFVGTKRQASEPVATGAKRCAQY